MLRRIRQTFVGMSLARFKIVKIISAVLILTFTLSVVVASALSVYTVTIQDSDSELSVSTRKTQPEEVLVQANMILSEDDFLDTSGFTEGADSTLTVYRACTINLIDDGDEKSMTACKDIEHTLAKNAVTIGPNDGVTPALEALVYEGMAVTIERAFGVTVIADDKKIQMDTLPGTVAEAVEKAGITLGEDDETQPALDTLLTAGMEIKILRVTYTQRSENEKVAFAKTVKKSKKMYIGDSKKLQAGVDGAKSVLYCDRFVNGVLDTSSVVSETVTQKAVPQVTLVGTMIKVSSIKFKSGLSPISNLPLPADVKLDANGIPLTYTKIIDGTAKAYSGGGTTSTGLPAKVGHIAVNPKQIPYGTRLYVVSLDGKYIYGYCIAADTGGFVKTNSCTIDIYMNTVEQCYAWGHRGVRIFVLD
ncbi:MAG TPA: G5 domain-containing protein [Clostridia bacterium]|nr:G5 domain-containing protein [Clostridia bacterium]